MVSARFPSPCFGPAEPQQELHGAADGRGLDLLLEKHAD